MQCCSGKAARKLAPCPSLIGRFQVVAYSFNAAEDTEEKGVISVAKVYGRGTRRGITVQILCLESSLLEDGMSFAVQTDKDHHERGMHEGSHRESQRRHDDPVGRKRSRHGWQILKRGYEDLNHGRVTLTKNPHHKKSSKVAEASSWCPCRDGIRLPHVRRTKRSKKLFARRFRRFRSSSGNSAKSERRKRFAHRRSRSLRGVICKTLSKGAVRLHSQRGRRRSVLSQECPARVDLPGFRRRH